MSHLLRFLSLGAVILLAGCAPSSYIVSSPAPSGIRFETSPPSRSDLSLVDKRADHVYSSGILHGALVAEDKPLDPPGFIAVHLQNELASRGVPVRVVRGDKGTPPRVYLTQFKMINHRATGFSPFVTFTYLAADVETPRGTRRVGTFIKRGKVPVWSFQEVVEPIFSQPLSLAVKELAAKIAAELYGARASDREVDQLAAKLGSRGADSFLDVYALGFTNNPRAVATIVTLVNDADEYVRLAAISSLGTLKATAQFDLLKSLSESANLWQDRAMALKAIGDLGTPEARAFLAQQKQYWQGRGRGNEPVWTLQVLGLYL